jgi:hypothetical protein
MPTSYSFAVFPGKIEIVIQRGLSKKGFKLPHGMGDLYDAQAR